MTRFDRRSLLAAAGAAVLAPAAPAQARRSGWTARAAMPWPVQEIYAAVLAGRIVTAGGLVAQTGQPLHIEDRTAIYDPAADRWSEGPRLPEPRHHPMLIAGAHELYAVGGYARSGAGEWTNTTTVWAMAAGDWRSRPALPSPQAEAVGVAVGETLHLITGRTPGGAANGNWNDQADTDRHLVLAPGDDRWREARPCPMARNSAAAAVMDGAVWVAGGRTVTGGGTGRLDRYDPAADRWDTLAPIPFSDAASMQVGGGLAMAAAGGRLVAFGGEWFRPRAEGGGGGVFRETWTYDPARDAWAAGPAMLTPRHGLAAAAIDGVVYAIGGGDVVSGGHATGVVEAFNP